MSTVLEKSQKPTRLLDQVGDAIRLRHYSIRTEKAYVQWIKRYILFHNKRHPREMGVNEVTAFLSYLATQRNVSASTQNQALNAIVFLYKHVLEIEIGDFGEFVRAKRPKRLPVVLTHDEAQSVLSQLQGREWLMANLLYGAGLRVMECARLRVKDIEFAHQAIIVRDGKGKKDRITVLPDILAPRLRDAIAHVEHLHEFDLKEGYGEVYLPYALSRKYPNAAKELGWQYLFPALVKEQMIHVRM